MPYIKKTIVAGKTTEIRKMNAPMYGRKKARAARQNLTTEKQRALNERHAVDTLTWTINENFGRCALFNITYILSDTEYCKPGYAILSIAPCAISRAGSTIPVYIREATQ